MHELLLNSNHCNYQFINTAEDIAKKCSVLSNDCQFSYFNLIQLNYCILKDYKAASITIAIIIMIFCFYFIANTSNKYLAPMLGMMCEKLNFSQNLAGLTILALGNQAPDVLVVIISSSNINEGISMSLGAVLGSSLLILHIVLSSVVIIGNKFEVVPCNYIRDFLVYLISLLIIIIFGLFKEIVIWESICFVILYFVYVAICVYMDKKTQEYLTNESWNLKGNEDISKDYEIKLCQDDILVVTQKDIMINDVIENSYFYERKNMTIVPEPSVDLNSTLFSKFKVKDIETNLNWSRM